jgi:hypothetical protein
MERAAVFAVLALVVGARAQSDAVLTVRTQPEGLEVWLGEKYLGDSPIVDRHVTAGRYTLRLVSGPMHVSETEEVYLQAGESKVVEKTVGVKYGSLQITTEPPGAEVSVGTSMGVTPLANDLMTPGKYRLEIRPPNRRYKGVTEEVTVPPGETVRIERTLERTSPFTTKALVRLLLGAGTVAGFTWAIIEQDAHSTYAEKSKTNPDYKSRSETAATWRTVGIVLGGACVLGFEIVAFF